MANEDFVLSRDQREILMRDASLLDVMNGVFWERSMGHQRDGPS